MNATNEVLNSRWQPVATLVAALSLSVAGCSQPTRTHQVPHDTSSLTIGLGLTAGVHARAGIQQVTRNIVLEGLVGFSRDGRPNPSLAETVETSSDGLRLTVRLRPNVAFHDGTPVSAEAVRQILSTQLPAYLGPIFNDIDSIQAVDRSTIQFSLKRRSALLVEALDIPLQAEGDGIIGTGPYVVARRSDTSVALKANDTYYAGRPAIGDIHIISHTSVRAAWAELLRNRVDMLYEVSADAHDLLEPSSDTKVFAYQRHYAYVALFNFRVPILRSSSLRRLLNEAVDRPMLIKEVFGGHGTPANQPLWPYHWALQPQGPMFGYAPRAVTGNETPISLRCLFGDPSLERLALALQQQLSAIGVRLALELVSADVMLQRLQTGDFDMALTDVPIGPNLVRPYWFWHSGSPYNWGQFASVPVDRALDTVRHSADDADYSAGVAAFQRAIVDDPPAIFLAWSERARAVSTRFEVPVEPGRDILSTLRLWRPAGIPRMADRN
jgi:peptide/nickel transport system substrate-binding protein